MQIRAPSVIPNQQQPNQNPMFPPAEYFNNLKNV